MAEPIGMVGSYEPKGHCGWCRKPGETVELTLGIFHATPLCLKKCLPQAIRIAATNGASKPAPVASVHRMAT